MPRSIVALVLACVLTTAVPSAASAEVWRAYDPAGDVTRTTSTLDPKPCGISTVEPSDDHPNADVIAVEVEHDRDSVHISVALADLRRAVDLSVTVGLRTPAGGWDLTIRKEPDLTGKVITSADISRQQPAPDELDECGGYTTISGTSRCGIKASMRPKRDVVIADVPRRCLRTPRWVRVSVETYDSKQSNDRSFRTMNDEWGTRQEGSWAPAYSPRIGIREGRVR